MIINPDFILNRQTLPVVEQMAQQLPGGFVLYKDNESGDILFVNDVLLEMYDCETLDEFRELTGYTFNGMVYPEDLNRILTSINDQIDGNHGSFDHVEYRITTKGGETRWIDDYGHFSYSEEYGDVFYVFLFDITEKKQALEAKSKFMFDMSDQLLTPMNAVSTFIKLALSHKDDPAALEKYLISADDAANRMIECIDRLVEIHRPSFSREGDVDSEGKQGPLRILIVEDNELNQLLLQTILEDAGFQVEIVDDGDKAVEAVRGRTPGHYDVLLMDIQMKRMSGYEATRQIRALPHADIDALPILAISANSRLEDIQMSLKCGMNAHLPKPYNPDQIIDSIYRYTRKAGAQAAAPCP